MMLSPTIICRAFLSLGAGCDDNLLGSDVEKSEEYAS